MRIDSRLHCSDIAIHQSLGGQQWRRDGKQKRKQRRPRSVGRRSSRCRNRSSASLEPMIVSLGPAVVAFSRGGPAPVIKGGVGGTKDAGFTIAPRRDGEAGMGRASFSRRQRRLVLQTSRRRPRCLLSTSRNFGALDLLHGAVFCVHRDAGEQSEIE